MPAFLLYTVALGISVGKILLPDSQRLYQVLIGSLVLFCSHIIMNVAAYYVYGTTQLTTTIILCIPLLIYALSIPTKPTVKIEEKQQKTKLIFLLLILVGLADIVLIYMMYTRQTTMLLVSPWQTVSAWFFILYACATGFLMWSLVKIKLNSTISYLITALHVITTFSVAAIIYKLGYGFDAFIHRATEEWILDHGFILPKNLYYIGQYSFVVFLNFITSVPIFYIDVFLVPLLAALFLPVTFSLMSHRVWNIPISTGLLGVFIMVYIPFWSLHLTTPYNLVLLLTFLIITTTLPAIKQRTNFLIPLIIALAALLSHPLIGAPAFLFVCVSWIYSRVQKITAKKIILAGYTLSLSLLLPLLFIIKNILSDGPLPIFHNPFLRLPYFFELFARPYWYATNVPILLQMLYTWEYIIPITIIILALYGYRRINKEEKKYYTIYIYTALGIFISAWFLRSWITFADVVIYEQGDYPLRLIKTSLLFLIPLSLYGIYHIIQVISQRWISRQSLSIQRGIHISFIALVSLLLMVSWYLSYPQLNQKVRFPGKNITQWDFEAVDWIHNDNIDYNYVVLANQLVSAAALTRYSFAQYFQTPHGELFYYAIPTGGLLYQDYGRMIYEGQELEYMLHAMDIAGVDKAYFVLNSYWADAPSIVEGAKKTANSWHAIGDNTIYIFTYTR